MAQRFGVTSSTTVRTATPTLGITPLAGRCTRSERVHRLRIGCSTNAHKHKRRPQHHARQLQHNETTAAPARMADNTPSRTTSPNYRIEDSTLFEYNPHRPRAQTRKHTPNPSPQPPVVARRKPQKIDSPRLNQTHLQVMDEPTEA